MDPGSIAGPDCKVIVSCLCKTSGGKDKKPKVLAVLKRDGWLHTGIARYRLPGVFEKFSSERHEVPIYCRRCTPARDMLYLNLLQVRLAMYRNPRRLLRIFVQQVSRRQSEIMREYRAQRREAASADALPE